MSTANKPNCQAHTVCMVGRVALLGLVAYGIYKIFIAKSDNGDEKKE